MSTYFVPATESLHDVSESPANRSEVYHAFASFADAQYQEIRSQAVEKGARYDLFVKRKKGVESEIDRQLRANPEASMREELRKVKDDAERAISAETVQLQEVKETVSVMLRQALTNYARALVASNGKDDDILRFTSLWLANADDDDLNEKTVSGLVVSIPSHKFVFLFHQLSARLDNAQNDSPFVKVINSLVARICSEHPFHSLYQINALRSSEAALPASSSSSSGRTRRSSTTSAGSTPASGSNQNIPRALAADAILEKVSKLKSRLKVRVAAVKRVCSAYIQWADHPLKSNPGFVHKSSRNIRKDLLELPKGLLITALSNEPIPVTTYDLPFDLTWNYDTSSYPTITKYYSKFSYPGGITAPKIVKCIGSDGKYYTQLVRSHSDSFEFED